jgi:hypothetical protein
VPLIVGTLTADNSGFGTLWKGVKDQDQVPGGVIVANGDGYLVTVKPAVKERRTHIEFKANDSVRAAPQYYSLLEPGRRLIEPCKERTLNSGTDGHFGNDKQTSDESSHKIMENLQSVPGAPLRDHSAGIDLRGDQKLGAGLYITLFLRVRTPL